MEVLSLALSCLKFYSFFLLLLFLLTPREGKGMDLGIQSSKKLNWIWNQEY
jgi:hypothetical protein